MSVSYDYSDVRELPYQNNYSYSYFNNKSLNNKSILSLMVVVTTLLGATSLSMSVLYLCQNKLIYPSWIKGARNHVENPESFGIPYKRIKLITKDKVSLEAYDMRIKNSLKDEKNQINTTVLILCPNSGNIGNFLPIAYKFYNLFNFNVILYSYRGYGNSNGSPSETGLKKDADCIMNYLMNNKYHQNNRILLYGQSLGGAIAIYIANKYPNFIDGMVIENTFLSIPKMLNDHLKFNIKFLLHEIWNNEVLINQLRDDLPVLFLSGSKDEKILPKQMETLYDKCSSDDKLIHKFPNGNHYNTINQPKYWAVIDKFLKEFN
ncbi:hypothetical protein TBLA_0A07935 [Henningerozyma blattae CBS 6284]|uniref:Serine aminopeptidase S33 domain-containing protein n=1 Tax=Henningerozyma blattae (strain ATCC 34711 / CBS 6284 / DSM 70876 / NBRC 10599 / NRRL Y-10934 / UCD 77-7) TaxID=1071380 RepID=I2GWT1_HENB6|nr:hypothetical protein TBLA_0A07935 [Tetrapisispora blattae CBS 6284]CCH58583.1 hypothetical protein TBLA_0A07935 [Tetrapisispora blattae CBS 6284]